MITKDFSAESLSLAIRKRDEPYYPFVRDKVWKKEYIAYLTNRIKSDTFDFKRLVKKNIRNFQVYRTQKLGDELILRQMSDSLKRSYKIKTSDRSGVVKQTSVLLQDSTDKHVFRLDIKSFYESVDRNLLLKKIAKDRKVSYLSIRYLSKFFSMLDRMGVRGLPRGLGISATLSEIYLSDLDDEVRRVRGVYFYGRYVDDIIIFSINTSEAVKEEVIKLLPQGMSLNIKKTKNFPVQCRCIPYCYHKPHICPCAERCECVTVLSNHQMSFLGYELQFSDVLGLNLNQPQQVRVELSRRKVNKIKYRLIHSVFAFIKNPDFDLFKMRVGFLTSNRRLRRLGSRGKLKTGIYYNHPLLTDPNIFKELDEFFRKIIHSKNSVLGKKLDSLITSTQRVELLKLTFSSGYSARRTKRITSGEVAKVKKCWNHG
jgi:hypothetical protein